MNEAQSLNIIKEIEDSCEIRRISFNGGDVVWRKWGSGPALVLIHGGSGSWLHWIRNIPFLAQHYSVYVPDLPGHGDSDLPTGDVTNLGPDEIGDLTKRNPPDKGALDIAVFARLIAQGIEILIPEGPIKIIGFSFGGYVSMRLCDYLPKERLKHIVLTGSIGLHSLSSIRRLNMHRWRSLKDKKEFRQAHRHNILELMIKNENKVDELAVDIQILCTQKSRLRRTIRKVNGALSLARIKPALSGIWGSEDATAIGKIDNIHSIMKNIDPSAEMVVFQNAGHWISYEEANDFNQEVLRLLQR